MQENEGGGGGKGGWGGEGEGEESCMMVLDYKEKSMLIW